MVNVRSSAAAEKGDEGMALKILTRAEDIPGGKDYLESQAHTKWKRTNKAYLSKFQLTLFLRKNKIIVTIKLE
jgi:hypothetical protein